MIVLNIMLKILAFLGLFTAIIAVAAIVFILIWTIIMIIKISKE